VLCGENLLLAGPKATGKNVLAENLAALFGRPVWDISMHINVDAASLIGTDTLKGGEVCFREGPVCQCARLGGFGALVGGLGFVLGIALVLVYDRKVVKKANIDYTITAFARKI